MKDIKVYAWIFSGVIIGGGIGSWIDGQLVLGVIIGGIIGCSIAIVRANTAPRKKKKKNSPLEKTDWTG